MKQVVMKSVPIQLNQEERYEEMQEFMKQVVMKSVPIQLNQEERNLLSVAYKNVVGARRASWRVLESIAKRGADKSDSFTMSRKTHVLNYKKKVETELTDICDDVLTLLNDYLLQNDSITSEERVFYCKMKGDYHRYKAEYLDGSKGSVAIEYAKEAYKEALTASKKLKSTNPIRLGLALNFSVFHYEIKKNKTEACRLAKNAFDDAVGELEDLTEEQYKDATLIMQLLRDNLTLWQSEGDEADEPALMNEGGMGEME